MEALNGHAHLSVVKTSERGANIKQRRLRHGFKSARAFAEVTGVDRQALTKAENGEGSEQTLARLEAWLDDFEVRTSSDADDAAEAAATPQTVTIKMAGVYGIEDVTISGPVDHLSELKDLAVELMRDVRERANDDRDNDR